jgi:hypothetical protein
MPPLTYSGYRFPRDIIVRPTFDPVEHLAAGSDGLDLSGPKIGKLGTLSVR